MTDIEKRLQKCFRLALPAVPPELIACCSQASTPEWDSLASVNLLTLIEEEFGLEIPEEDLVEFRSWELVLDWLQTRVAS